MYLDNVLQIDGVTVRKDITDSHFVCDISKCKGACCTMESEYGAPIKKEEIEEITRVLPMVMEYLPAKHAEEIKDNGFWEEKEGDLLTRSINNRACVFVYYESGIAKCGIEKAYKDGKISVNKPISCHLFPIRVTKFGGDILRYERIPECHDAVENGVKLNVTIADFCKESLLRLYGPSWFEKLTVARR